MKELLLDNDMTPEEWKRKLRTDPVFFCQLVFGGLTKAQRARFELLIAWQKRVDAVKDT